MPQTGTPGNGQGPWSAAVQQDFADDPALAARVEQFMQTRYQPYVTRLEGEKTAAKEAVDFYNSFQEDSGAAFLSLAEHMFGEDGVDAIVAALDSEEETETVTTPETEAERVAALSPEDQELLAWARSKRDAEVQENESLTYKQQKEAFLASDEQYKDIDPALFDPFVAANEGDWAAAAEAYKTFRGAFEPAKEPDPDPPATLPGSAATPATQRSGLTFDEAWDEFSAELAALKPAPPTV